jgi:hypothetical protein
VASFPFVFHSSTQPQRPLIAKLIGYLMPLVWAFGWFLMSAPYAGSSTDRKIDASAPLSEWHILAPYHSLADCQKKVHLLVDPTGASSSDENTIRCVSSDDKRIHLGGPLPDAAEGPTL